MSGVGKNREVGEDTSTIGSGHITPALHGEVVNRESPVRSTKMIN